MGFFFPALFLNWVRKGFQVVSDEVAAPGYLLVFPRVYLIQPLKFFFVYLIGKKLVLNIRRKESNSVADTHTCFSSIQTIKPILDKAVHLDISLNGSETRTIIASGQHCHFSIFPFYFLFTKYPIAVKFSVILIPAIDKITWNKLPVQKICNMEYLLCLAIVQIHDPARHCVALSSLCMVPPAFTSNNFVHPLGLRGLSYDQGLQNTEVSYALDKLLTQILIVPGVVRSSLQSEGMEHGDGDGLKPNHDTPGPSIINREFSFLSCWLTL